MFQERSCPQNVRRLLGGIRRKWHDLAPFERIRPIFFNDLRDKHYPPKAEVTGSNPVGCANDFNWLHGSSEGSVRGYFRIILFVLTPYLSAPRIAHAAKIDNWKSRAFPGKALKQHGNCWEVVTLAR
jgi:hypothetical protein